MAGKPGNFQMFKYFTDWPLWPCQREAKLNTMNPELHPIVTKQTWEVIGMDLIGCFEPTEWGNR